MKRVRRHEVLEHVVADDVVRCEPCGRQRQERKQSNDTRASPVHRAHQPIQPCRVGSRGGFPRIESGLQQRQQRHAQDERDGDAHGDHVAEDSNGRRRAERQTEKTQRRRRVGQRHRQQVVSGRRNRGLRRSGPAGPVTMVGKRHVHTASQADAEDNDRRESVYRRQLRAEEAGDAEGCEDGSDSNRQQDEHRPPASQQPPQNGRHHQQQ